MSEFKGFRFNEEDEDNYEEEYMDVELNMSLEDPSELINDWTLIIQHAQSEEELAAMISDMFNDIRSYTIREVLIGQIQNSAGALARLQSFEDHDGYDDDEDYGDW